MRRATAVPAALALLCSGTAAAVTAAASEPPRPADAPGLQRLVDRVVAAGAPGATLLVDDGASTRSYTSGVADLETERPVRAGDRYRAGSVTKTAVATLVLQLVEDGELDLDAPLATYLAGLLPDGDTITIRQLLSHTSGLFDHLNDDEFVDRLLAGDSFRPRELIDYSTRHDLLFPPGTDWSYSNTNFVVLGVLLRKVADQKVKIQLNERILEPLGLARTTFPIGDTRMPGRFSHGYLRSPGGEYLDATFDFSPTWAWASGALISTTSDVAAMYRGVLGGEVIDEVSLEEMKEPPPGSDGYGLGLAAVDLPCGTAYGHDGIFFGYYTFGLSTEDGARQSVVMMNVDPLNGKPPPDALAAAQAALAAGLCGADSPSLAGPLDPPALRSLGSRRRRAERSRPVTSAVGSGEPGRDGQALHARVARLAADPTFVRLEGMHCVKHALRFGADVVLLVSADRAATIDLASRLAPDVRDRLVADLIEVATQHEHDVIGPGRFDVVAFARRPSPVEASTAAPAVLLEDPRNLGNLGAVVRVAAGFGARAIWTTGSVDPWHPTVVRASAGLHFAVQVERFLDADAAIGTRQPLIAFDPTGDDLRSVTITDDAVLAFGSERRGLSPGLRSRADQLVAIPIRAQVSSYNLATSVAVALFHWKSTGGPESNRR